MQSRGSKNSPDEMPGDVCLYAEKKISIKFYKEPLCTIPVVSEKLSPAATSRLGLSTMAGR